MKNSHLNIITFLIFVTGSIACAILDAPYILIITAIAVFSLKIYIHNNQKTLDLVKNKFEKMGYIAISERPYTFSELKPYIKFKKVNFTINDIPIEHYGPVKQIKRVFTVKQGEQIFELFATVIKTDKELLEIQIHDKILLSKS